MLSVGNGVLLACDILDRNKLTSKTAFLLNTNKYAICCCEIS